MTTIFRLFPISLLKDQATSLWWWIFRLVLVSSCPYLLLLHPQGVGDLYTDPQIHTALGTEYGDGNLGTKVISHFDL